MAAGAGTVGRDHVVEFVVMTGSGAPDTGVAPGEFIPRVRALDTATDDGAVAAVVEIGSGRYSLIIRGTFTTAQAAGNYAWSVERTTAGRTHIISGNVRFFVRDIDDLAQPGDAMDLVANAVDDAAVAVGAITADAFATDAIDAAAIAADAIGASELATSAVNEIRDSMLSDSTPFAGANINATISSRSSHSPGDVDTVLTAAHGPGSWQSASAENDMAHSTFNYNTAAPATVRQEVWAEIDGVPQTAPTSATISLRDDAGLEVFSDASSSPDPQGVFTFTNSPVALTPKRSYVLEVAVLVGADTIRSKWGVDVSP